MINASLIPTKPQSKPRYINTSLAVPVTDELETGPPANKEAMRQTWKMIDLRDSYMQAQEVKEPEVKPKA